MSSTFDISPEKRAGLPAFLYRQLFVTPPPVLPRDVDLDGKTAIVTGSNGGLGLETARQLLDLGSRVILAVRDEAKGEAARRSLFAGRDLPATSIQVWRLDLSDYSSIASFVERCRSLEHLDIAILNAGIYKVTESFDSSGYEEDIHINYLSNMLLTLLLLPVIKEKKSAGGPGHISVVSSDAGAWSRFEERGSDPLLAAFKQKMPTWNNAERYATGKLLQQLFIAELSKHIPPSIVTLSCSNPGFCRGSDLARETSGLFRLFYSLNSLLLSRSPSVGARTLVHAVTTLGDKTHGQYVEDAKIQPMPPIAYQPDGLRVAQKLYEETLDEFDFASVRSIVEGFQKSR